MDKNELYNQWYFWLVIATVLIVVAALLLIAVWMAAKRILKLATAAQGIVVQIKENTNSIWGLDKTNEIATNILNETEMIGDHTIKVGEALRDSNKVNSLI